MLKIINVMAASLNARIGAEKLESDQARQKLGLSSREDHEFLKEQIRGADAIIVGASSIRANGQCLEELGKDGKPPTWFILAQNELPFDMPFWAQSHIPRVLVSPAALKIKDGSGVTNLVYSAGSPARFIHRTLEKLKVSCALLFGGGIVNKFFYDEELVDELKLTLSPLFIAGSAQPELISQDLKRHVRFRLVSSHSSQSFVFLSYEVLKN